MSVTLHKRPSLREPPAGWTRGAPLTSLEEALLHALRQTTAEREALDARVLFLEDREGFAAHQAEVLKRALQSDLDARQAALAELRKELQEQGVCFQDAALDDLEAVVAMREAEQETLAKECQELSEQLAGRRREIIDEAAGFRHEAMEAWLRSAMGPPPQNCQSLRLPVKQRSTIAEENSIPAPSLDLSSHASTTPRAETHGVTSRLNGQRMAPRQRPAEVSKVSVSKPATGLSKVSKGSAGVPRSPTAERRPGTPTLQRSTSETTPLVRTARGSGANGAVQRPAPHRPSTAQPARCSKGGTRSLRSPPRSPSCHTFPESLTKIHENASAHSPSKRGKVGSGAHLGEEEATACSLQ